MVELPEHIKALGPKQVETMMHVGSLPAPFWPAATQWLAEQDHELRRLNDASQASQTRTALSAKRAAWIAAIAAIIAAVAAIVSIIVEIMK